MATKRKAAPKSATRRKFKGEFDEKNLWSSVIAIPLLEDLEKAQKKRSRKNFEVVIDLNLDCRGGRHAARRKVLRLLGELSIAAKRIQAAEEKSRGVEQYLFITLSAREIRQLVIEDQQQKVSDADLPKLDSHVDKTRPAANPEPASTAPRPPEFVSVDAGDRVSRNERAIYRIWPDFPIELHLTKSISTVKADAAHRAFYAYGEDIVWAVIDSGIEDHPHFKTHDNLGLAPPIAHRDFTTTSAKDANPLLDLPGHGTHVAGIIAGSSPRTLKTWPPRSRITSTRTAKPSACSSRFPRSPAWLRDASWSASGL